VFDDDHGIALIAKLAQDVDQPEVIPRVEADRRLVQHVQCADQRRAERRGQVDALRFAAGQRRRQAIQAQIVEADVAQEHQPAPDLLQHLLGDRRLFLGERQRFEECLRLAHRERRDAIDGAAGDVHVAGLAAQPCAAAIRAGQVSAVAAQEDADVNLVFLLFEPAEEAADSVVVVVAFDDEVPLFVGEFAPGDVEPELRLLRCPFQLGELGPVVRLAPWLDRVLIDRLQRVWDHQRHVQLDDVAETMAGRTGAERIVEGEQPRLRILVRNAAGAALEALGELVHDRCVLVGAGLDLG
jgi:hypothetical protein